MADQEASCKGLNNAAEKSGNLKVIEHAKARCAPVEPPGKLT
jgi:hypothetical protein